MLAKNIILDSESAAIFLGISRRTMAKYLPVKESYDLHELYHAPIPMQVKWKEEPKAPKDEPIIMLKVKPAFIGSKIAAAVFPAPVPSSALHKITVFLQSAPFLISVVDCLHYLNDSHLHKHQSMEAVAMSLSKQGFFKLKTIQKGDPEYQLELVENYYNPPVLAA